VADYHANMSRLSRGRSLLPQTRARPAKKKGQRNQSLSALAIAEETNPERNKIRRSRLGEIEGFGTRQRDRSLGDHGDGERASKRRKTERPEEDENGVETGSDSDGNKWHIGIDSSGEDSELDSDNALGESDEERFEGFAFRGSTSQSSQHPRSGRAYQQASTNKEIDLSEGEDDAAASHNTDEDDDLAEGTVDLATALDINMEEEAGEQRERQDRSSTKGAAPLGDDFDSSESAHSESGGGEGEDSDRDDGGDEDTESDLAFSVATADDNGDEPANTSRLLKFVEGLQGPMANSLPERQEPSNIPDKPSDFGVRSSRKLTLADLQPTVKDHGLMKSLKMLQNSEKVGPRAYSGGIPGKLEPPLPKRQQDRLDRATAYDKSKETLNRWVDTVKHNRRAEHVSFPLPDLDKLSAPGTKELIPTALSQPLTSLEATIQNIMQESGLAPQKSQFADHQDQPVEELQGRTMRIEEVQARRAELRKARDLIFREEIRARRIKKIKSKSYRRVHRKDREKMAHEERAALEAAGFINSDEERERNDRRRAEERMGARHRESKWAKGVKASGRATWDEEARMGVADLARRDEELRRRIEGKKILDPAASDSEPSSSDSDDAASSFGSDGGSRRRLLGKLEELDAPEPASLPWSKLASMAFMQKAEALHKAANDAEIKQLRQDLGGDGIEEVEATLPESVGRLKFSSQKTKLQEGPIAQQSRKMNQAGRNEFEERMSEDEEIAEQRSRAESQDVAFEIEEHPQISRPSAQTKNSSITSKSEASTNPWLESTPRSKKGHIKSGNSIGTEPGTEPSSPKKKHKTSKEKQSTPVLMADETSSSGSDDGGSGLSFEAQPALSRNEEMVRMMFAGDDVFEDFDKEKRETIKDEGDQVIDNTLPGWGNWTGAGISKREQKRGKGRFVTTIKGVPEDKRKDAKLDKVIVNEKRVKKVRDHC
jgi:U3 small nucleolar RNA-associated protein 14